VIVIDEIGTELEAAAARTIAERGVQLIGTAHGNNLDNLMLNPTLSDLIGGIQSVTLGDEEARRRRTQKSVLERKAPPTFDVVVEIQDRDRVVVHSDVADTVDALLRGEPLAPELRWRDEGGVHRSQSRPRPSPNSVLPGERFGGLVGTGAGWRMEPGWRPELAGLEGGLRGERGARPGYRSGSSGGWRAGRGRAGSREAGSRGSRRSERSGGPGRAAASGASLPGEIPFRTGEIADRGPLERNSEPSPERRAREARELDRQREWRESAARAIQSLRAEEGTAPVPVGDEVAPDAGSDSVVARPDGETAPAALGEDADDEDDVEVLSASEGQPAATTLPTIRVLGFGISRKRLEQAIRELQLPVVVVRDIEDAEVVITLRNYYKQKAPALREAEERALPIYVLKSNTIVQMEACLTSLYSLELDPGEAALRETEDAIHLVLRQAKPVELAPQNAYIRRLQHQMAERANLVSRSRGREPYRRVRLYPDQVRAWH
jgi:R3H domain-containing protein